MAYCNQNDDYIEDCYLIDDADLGNLITEDNKYTSSDSCVHLSCRLPEPNDEDNVSADNG